VITERKKDTFRSSNVYGHNKIKKLSFTIATQLLKIGSLML